MKIDVSFDIEVFRIYNYLFFLPTHFLTVCVINFRFAEISLTDVEEGMNLNIVYFHNQREKYKSEGFFEDGCDWQEKEKPSSERKKSSEKLETETAGPAIPS